MEAFFSWRQHGRAVWFSCDGLSARQDFRQTFFWIIELPRLRELRSSHGDYFREQVLRQMLYAEVWLWDTFPPMAPHQIQCCFFFVLNLFGVFVWLCICDGNPLLCWNETELESSESPRIICSIRFFWWFIFEIKLDFNYTLILLIFPPLICYTSYWGVSQCWGISEITFLFLEEMVERHVSKH